ncbi:secreted RxLR effector protein 161-like [Apium graveolens]|uniref:secreted RxLR effector protein 161-like n=1 Tax=Apium graveolens TaxID=4045 RepID=UPI003D7B11EB
MTYLLEEGDPKTYMGAVTSPDEPMWKEAIKNEVDSFMQNHTWELVDLPTGCIPLGSKTSKGIALSQPHYIDKILEKFLKDDFEKSRSPVDMTLHLSKNKGVGVSQVEYSRIIGSLMYLMSCTRPEIAYSISMLSRFTSNLGADHWKAIIRVLRYLRGTRDYGLYYGRYPAVLEGYTDTNWISSKKALKSMSGYVFTLAGAAVSWKSSKQMVITHSTMKVEFVTLDKCAEEAEYLQHRARCIMEKPVIYDDDIVPLDY